MADDHVRTGIWAFDSVFGYLEPASLNLLVGRTDLNFRILDRLAVLHAAAGGNVYYVDGAGRSNPFSMAQVLRGFRSDPPASWTEPERSEGRPDEESEKRGLTTRRADPYGPLSRINIARAFTAHQLDSLVREALPSVRPKPTLAIVTGIDSLFSDPEVKDDEASGMLENCMEALEGITRAGCSVLLGATGGSRSGELLGILGARATKWASLKERPGGRIRIVVRDGRWTDFVPIHPMQTLLDDFGEVPA
jgi:hypothetical protein